MGGICSKSKVRKPKSALAQSGGTKKQRTGGVVFKAQAPTTTLLSARNHEYEVEEEEKRRQWKDVYNPSLTSQASYYTCLSEPFGDAQDNNNNNDDDDDSYATPFSLTPSATSLFAVNDGSSIVTPAATPFFPPHDHPDHAKCVQRLHMFRPLPSTLASIDWKKHTPSCTTTSNPWQPLTAVDASVLSRGDSLMSFSCKTGTQLSDCERCVTQLILNLNSVFAVEFGDDSPHFDLYKSSLDGGNYTFIMSRATFVVPYFDLSKLTPELVASYEYVKQCFPGNPKVWDKWGTTDEDLRTFRISKPMAPMISSVVQMRVSDIADREILSELEETIDELPIKRAHLLERTTRGGKRKESIAKMRTVRLYYELPEKTAILVSNVSIVANHYLPKLMIPVVNSLGSRYSGEVKDTAKRTRQYVVDHLK